ncbi:MAG: polysaccharide biosynthesis C-terminal domain-containing protein [Phycisphaerae bacterium]
MAQEPKKNALLNVGMSVVQVGLAGFFGVFLTSMLVKRLGVEYYGFVPLFGSVGMYLGLLTVLFSSSIGRFTAMSFYKGDIEDASRYYTSGFIALASLSLLGFAVVLIVSRFLDVFFDIPDGALAQVRIYFITLSAGVLVSSVTATFNVAFFIKHSFFLGDIILVVRKAAQILFIILMLHRLSLPVVGLSNILVACLGIVLAWGVSRKLMPELRINLKQFRFSYCKEMAEMGISVLVNQLGGILYFQSSLMIVNITLGAGEAGRFGIVFQAMMLAQMFSMIVLKLFGPVVVEQVSNGHMEIIKGHLQRFTKLITIGNGLFVALVSGFAKPLLSLWVGEEFVDLQKLLVIMGFATILMYSPGLVFNVLKAMNKIKVPSRVTLIMGAINIALTLFLIKYTGLGIYGVAISVFVCTCIKAVLFNAIYLGKLIDMNPMRVWLPLATGLIPCVIFVIATNYFCLLYNIDSVLKLFVCGGGFALLYCFVSFYFFIDRKDRVLLLEILKFDKMLSPAMCKLILK